MLGVTVSLYDVLLVQEIETGLIFHPALNSMAKQGTHSAPTGLQVRSSAVHQSDQSLVEYA